MIKPVKRIITVISNYVALDFFKKFILCFSSLYCINHCFLLLVNPGHFLYVPFLDQNINYVAGFIHLILQASNLIAHAFGLSTYVVYPDILKIDHGASIVMWYPCAGIGMSTLWVLD